MSEPTDFVEPLDSADPHVKLAVDLIMILEEHDIDPQTVLDALPIIEMDYRSKILYNENTPKN